MLLVKDYVDHLGYRLRRLLSLSLGQFRSFLQYSRFRTAQRVVFTPESKIIA